MVKLQEIKVRVPLSMKNAVVKLATGRMTSESEIVREAIMAYLDKHGTTVAHLLQEEGPECRTTQSAKKGRLRKIEAEAIRALDRRAASARQK